MNLNILFFLIKLHVVLCVLTQTAYSFSPSSSLSFIPSHKVQSQLRLQHYYPKKYPQHYAKQSKNDDSMKTNIDDDIIKCTTLLNKAAETKAEDPDLVLESLMSLEQLMKTKRKSSSSSSDSSDDYSVSRNIVEKLNGSWRLIFTTGTKKTQERFETRINYFPIKAVQSFDTKSTPYQIENGIYVGDFALLKFAGDFDFDLKKSKLEFTFDKISILQFPFIELKKDEAAKIGAKTGLGSESNVKNAQKDKKAFFNWISADDNIATARGGGGGLALWKRIN